MNLPALPGLTRVLAALLVAAVACTGQTDPPSRDIGPTDPLLNDVLVLGTRDGTVIDTESAPRP